jgi:hypothetical protein
MQTTTTGKHRAREKLLKLNQYKRVALVHDPGALPCVVKSFGGHTAEDCRENALHTYRSLQLMRARFAHVLRSPAPLDLDLDDCSVRMEYLSDLPAARQLRLTDIPSLSGFFATCYELEQDIGYLGSIRDSVHLTDSTRQLIESGFPMRLGFKGDLYQNLRVGERGLLLADTETASVEPLGLSELVLYIFLASSLRSPARFRRRVAKSMRPVAFGYLSDAQCRDLIEAALELAETGMQHVPNPIRAAKLFIARSFLCRTLGGD